LDDVEMIPLEISLDLWIAKKPFEVSKRNGKSQDIRAVGPLDRL
jgi:hypothetical protein